MLILSRRLGESVLVGNDLEVVVVDLGGGQVKLAFKAPPETRIVRRELAPPSRKNKGPASN